MKILVATDFSEPARHATDLAVALAGRMGDQVTLIHVVNPTLITPLEVVAIPDALERAVSEGASARMKQEKDLAAASGVPIESRVEIGDLVDTIAHLSKNDEVRMLVVGTSGRRPAARFFLGSSAARMVLAAERPTLVVRKTGDEALLSWARHATSDRPLRLLVGLERSAACTHAVDWVRSLRAKMACDVTFVHFYWPPEQIGRLGFHGGEDLQEPDPTTVAVLEREMRAFVGDVNGPGLTHFKILPQWGDQVGSHLAMMASELGADMLVLGTHQRHGLKRMWLGGTTQPALHASSVPVLCIPSAHEKEAQPTLTNQVRSVLAVTDLSPLGNSAIPHAYGMLAAGGTVHLVHVHDRYLPDAVFPFPIARGSIFETALEAELQEKLRALVPKDADKYDLKTRIHIIEGGHTPTAILQTANRLGVDAVCLASHGRTGLTKAIVGSVADEVVKGADRPVYVIRGQLER